MKSKIAHHVIAFTGLLVFLLPFSLNADYIVKKNKHTTETVTNGADEKSSVENGTTWISKNKMRQDDGNATSIIIRLDKKKVFVLNHIEKTYSEMDLPVDLEENTPHETHSIIKVMKISSSVFEAKETRVIKGWKSHKFTADISISIMGMEMPMTMEIWASKDTGIDLRTFRKFYAVLLSINPFTKDLWEEFQKIEGYPLLTKISMKVKGMETKSEEEVVTVEENKAPRGTYDLPSEYTRVAYNPLIFGNGNAQR
jgi:hypothetical protein